MLILVRTLLISSERAPGLTHLQPQADVAAVRNDVDQLMIEFKKLPKVISTIT